MTPDEKAVGVLPPKRLTRIQALNMRRQVIFNTRKAKSLEGTRKAREARRGNKKVYSV